MKTEKIVLNEERNVTLTAYLQEVEGEFGNIPKRPAMLILPGGGYTMCSDREADPVAFVYLEAGYQVFILRYSVKEHAAWPNPLDDYEQAMELIRFRSEEWKLYPDKVAVIGFSAGGHLAACAATIAKNKPDAVILGYPAVEEETVKMCLESAPEVIGRVNEHTAPCFVFATRTDTLVPVSNVTGFISALAQYGIMFESHIYAYGPHGFTVCNSAVLSPETEICSRVPQWVGDSVEWLKDVLGDFGNGQMTMRLPRCRKRINDDYESFCTIDCTMKTLMENEEAHSILEPVISVVKNKLLQEYGGAMESGEEGTAKGKSMAGMIARLTLRNVMKYAGIPEETAGQLDERLRKVKNR